MRTRNKPAKESNNKRPKRGGDAPDASATNENAKTPNKTDRRKSSKETPTKGKKRANIDLDADNDGSDEKEKRKRTDSPTESLNSDSRPGSVLDEQENTNEPPDTPMAEADRKETDSKVEMDTASPVDESNSNAAPSKDDKTNATSTSMADKSEPIVADKNKESSCEKPRTISSDDSSHSADDKSNEITAATSIAPVKVISEPSAPISKANNSTVTAAATTVTNTITNAISSTIQAISPPSIVPAAIVSVAPPGDLKPIEKMEAKLDTPFAPKEQEIISTVANIKKESSAPVDIDNSNECIGKKVSMVIKKEPNDESTEGSKDSSNANTIGTLASGKDAVVEPPSDIKMANDIKTESKCGLDLTDINSKHEDGGSRSAFEPHIKFSAIGKLPPEQTTHMKFNSEPPKPIPEQLKFGPDALLAAKYPPMAADLSQKYESKLFATDHANKLNESEIKDKANSDGEWFLLLLKNELN